MFPAIFSKHELSQQFFRWEKYTRCQDSSTAKDNLSRGYCFVGFTMAPLLAVGFEKKIPIFMATKGETEIVNINAPS